MLSRSLTITKGAVMSIKLTKAQRRVVELLQQGYKIYRGQARSYYVYTAEGIHTGLKVVQPAVINRLYHMGFIALYGGYAMLTHKGMAYGRGSNE